MRRSLVTVALLVVGVSGCTKDETELGGITVLGAVVAVAIVMLARYGGSAESPRHYLAATTTPLWSWETDYPQLSERGAFDHADIWRAYEAGAKDARAFSQQFHAGSPDDLIRRSADAYVKSVSDKPASSAPPASGATP